MLASTQQLLLTMSTPQSRRLQWPAIKVHYCPFSSLKSQFNVDSLFNRNRRSAEFGEIKKYCSSPPVLYIAGNQAEIYTFNGMTGRAAI